MKKRKCTICVVKTKALISFVVTAKLVCAFVFAYADRWFSDAAAHLSIKCKCLLLYPHFLKNMPVAWIKNDIIRVVFETTTVF